jgi:cytochrome c oxidase subunit IV
MRWSLVKNTKKDIINKALLFFLLFSLLSWATITFIFWVLVPPKLRYSEVLLSGARA